MRAKAKKSQRLAATAKDLAICLGLPYRRVWRWTQDPTFPAKGPHGWRVSEVRAWASNLRENRAMDAPGQSAGVRADLLRAQADERRAKADLADLRLKIERGEYRATKDIQEWDLARLAIFRRGLLGLGRTLAPALVGLTEREIEAMINRKAREMLERWAKM